MKTDQAVLMEHISSREYLYREGSEAEQVLKDISLIINRGEVWGIKGNSLFEIKLLLEIMANIRPYEKGRCVLIQKGMMRQKRVILEHVFYIGSSEMIYPNMNVLEFLMFATAKFKMDAVDRQEQIFEFLIEAGLGYLSLTPIRFLSKEEKGVVTLIAGAYSNSRIIVFNLPDYEFDTPLIDAVIPITALIREGGKALILGTRSDLLLGKVSTHIGVIGKGEVLYQGRTADFRHAYDKIAVIVEDDEVYDIRERLKEFLPGTMTFIEGKRLFVKESSQADQDMIYRKILAAGFMPQKIEKNLKRVEYAYEELMREHDL